MFFKEGDRYRRSKFIHKHATADEPREAEAAGSLLEGGSLISAARGGQGGQLPFLPPTFSARGRIN